MAIRKDYRKNGMYLAYIKYQGRQYSKACATKAEAKAWEVMKRQELANLIEDPVHLMYVAGGKAYLQDCEVRMQTGTYEEKVRHIEEFWRFVGKDIRMGTVSVLLAKKFVQDVQQQRGNKAANRRLRTLKACWNWHKEYLPHNPWRAVPIFPEKAPIKHVPAAEDMKAVLSHANGWERAILGFLLHTGARIGEAIGLLWEDVNFERGTVILWTRKRKHGSRQPRCLPLTSGLRAILETIQAGMAADTPHVFINPQTGEPYRTRQPSVRYMLKRLCGKAGVKAFGFHGIRHYTAQRLMDSRLASIVDIQLMLGHQRATTTDSYLRTLSSNISHLAEIIETAVLPQSTE